jgi:protein associated with RNAse G/E
MWPDEGRYLNSMQPDFSVESRSYDLLVRGSWQAYRLDTHAQLSDELLTETSSDCLRLWLPAGTPMHWSTRTRPLQYNCLQFFWPRRWYMLSAFYDDRVLRHTYATVIQPPNIEIERLTYVDLDLSVLIKPDLTYEILTQAEFEQMAELLHYDEETRIGALMALRTLTSSIQLSVGLFASVPHLLRQTDFHLATCKNR